MKLWLFARNVPAIVWPPAAVYGLHVLRMLLLPTHYELDMVAHFLGGFSMAWVAWNAHRYAVATRTLTEPPAVFLFVWIVSIALTIGVLWESMEYYLLQNQLGLIRVSLADTELDLVLDLCGAMVFGFAALRAFPHRPWKLQK